MDNLYLPEEFRQYEDWMYKGKGARGEILKLILTALSDARDELHKKDCIIGDLVSDKKGLRNENKRLREVIKYMGENSEFLYKDVPDYVLDALSKDS